MNNSDNRPFLVTGAAGAIGGIGRSLTENFLLKGRKVRALVRREDERAKALRKRGAEIVVGDLTDLDSMHRAIEGTSGLYLGMSVSPSYLEATVNTAAVARHHGVGIIVNMSQMTVSQMSINETTNSPQHKLHWLAEQALVWSGLPVVTMRPTVFMEGFFLRFAAAGIRENDELLLPLGNSKTSPVSARDVSDAIAEILINPAPHIGKIYNLTGPESENMEHYAHVFSQALGKRIHYRNVSITTWAENLRKTGIPVHVVNHLSVMAELHQKGLYDRMTNDLPVLTGKSSTTMYDFVKSHKGDYVTN